MSSISAAANTTQQLAKTEKVEKKMEKREITKFNTLFPSNEML